MTTKLPQCSVTWSGTVSDGELTGPCPLTPIRHPFEARFGPLCALHAIMAAPDNGPQSRALLAQFDEYARTLIDGAGLSDGEGATSEACMALYLGRACDLEAGHDGNHQAETVRGARTWSDEDHAGVENAPTPSEPLLSAASPESGRAGDCDSTPACSCGSPRLLPRRHAPLRLPAPHHRDPLETTVSAATEAQVAAAMEALGCEPNPWSTKGGRGVPAAMPDGEIWSHCSTHHGGEKWTDRGCPVAIAVADAVVAAGPDPAKVAADALREAVQHAIDVGAVKSGDRVWTAYLSERADQIEAGS